MTSSRPTDPVLYAKVKKTISQKYPQHSAYRSGHIVRAYKSAVLEVEVAHEFNLFFLSTQE